jgi:hypothetical protein
MIDIAAHATEGVNLPNRAQTRQQIIETFKDQMNWLKIRLHVHCSNLFGFQSNSCLRLLQSDAVTGKIHITCDAWQASNTDGYYAITGHWMEESSPGVWVLQEALLGFTHLNNAHHGVRLGQALYKVVKQFDIVDRVSCLWLYIAISIAYYSLQVGYVMCNNAPNNGTMLEFARQVQHETGETWDPIERRIKYVIVISRVGVG